MIGAWELGKGVDWIAVFNLRAFLCSFSVVQDRNFDTLCGMSGVSLFLLQLHTFFCKLVPCIHESNIIITLF
jgi:hypothetical protein